MPKPPVKLDELEALIKIVEDLRGPEGCPWDKEQTHQSLVPYAIEEVHELAEALEGTRDEVIKDELGDVLFQVVLHAQLASERNSFTFNDVVENIAKKLVRRHPHVFAETQVSGTDEVIRNWETIKAQEKKEAAGSVQSSNILNVPRGLPALQRAAKIGFRTQKLKFDWDTPEQVLEKVREEQVEMEEALKSGVKEDLVHEIGDVLFSVAQLSRHLGLDPEQCLREANRRFENRFVHMVGLMNQDGHSLENLELNAKESYWQKAKAELKEQKT